MHGRGGGGPEIEGSFDADKTLSHKDQRRVDDFILFAIAAAAVGGLVTASAPVGPDGLGESASAPAAVATSASGTPPLPRRAHWKV